MTNRLLNTDELTELVQGLAEHPELWRDQVCHDASERQYARIISTETVEIYAIGWMDGHDTGFHDHDDAAAAIHVVDGELVDERLALGAEPLAQRHRAGATFTVEPAAIHRVRHTGGPAATTLHAYSPPLTRMGRYEVGPGGELLRHSGSGEDRLEATSA